MVPRDLYDPSDEHQRKILWATVRRRGSCGACDHEKSSRAQCCTQITVFNTHWPLGSVARKRAAEMVWELATSLPLPQVCYLLMCLSQPTKRLIVVCKQ